MANSFPVCFSTFHSKLASNPCLRSSDKNDDCDHTLPHDAKLVSHYLLPYLHYAGDPAALEQ